MRKCGLGAAQTVPVAGDVTANIADHVRLAKVAAEMGAAVLVFPELSLTGYEMRLAKDLAFTVEDSRLDSLVHVAQSREIVLVVGAPTTIGGELYIAALIIGIDGRVQVYTKHFLGAFPLSASVDGTVPAGESTVFTKGALNPLVDVAGHQAAVAVCADANHASHAAAAAARGANTYLASMFVIPSEFEEVSSNLREHAKQHEMTIVFSNYGGNTGGLRTAGQSGLWSREGDVMGRLDRQGSGVIVGIETEAGWQVETCRA